MATSLSMSMLDADDRTKKYSLPFNGGVFRISTVKWPNWYVYMQSNGEGNVRGWEGLPGYQGELIFTPDTSNSELFLISTKTWPDWYIYMQDNADGNVRGWKGDPGPQGHWHITPRHDGTFMLSTVKWEHWYMYMQDKKDGNVRGYGGNPGPQGHFILSCDLRLSQP